jgi:hypothetical protein
VKKLFIGIVAILFSANGLTGELEHLAESYLSAYKGNDLTRAATMLHCPESYSKRELLADRESIPKTLSIFIEEFGPLESYKLSDSNLYVAAMTGCGTAKYWEKNKPTKQLVYETIHSNGQDGYIMLSYAFINGKYVLAFANHGVPMLGEKSVIKIKQVYKRVANKGT